NPNREIFIREEGNLRKLYYSEILAHRSENKEIIAKFCTQRVEENITNRAIYETRAAGEPSTKSALKKALVAGDIEEARTLLDIAMLDYKIEQAIRDFLDKEDFDGALSELNNAKNNTQDGKNTTNTPWVFNTNSQGNSGGIGGRKASDSSKNERHGDGGRALEKARKANEKLQEKLDRGNLSRIEKERIEKKMERNIKNAKSKQKGENHSRRGK
ncbi:MAG: hypothetical protein IJ566_03205, partial [Cardiobacteriaceae bacterium]|nr:hypothetical protein [Cardiobacteriaceae bacterium]